MNSNKSKRQAPSILGVVTVNEKGQVVIPASARSIINIESGDKLLVMAHPSKEGLVLIKPDGLEDYAKRMLEQLSAAKDSYQKNNGA